MAMFRSHKNPGSNPSTNVGSVLGYRVTGRPSTVDSEGHKPSITASYSASLNSESYVSKTEKIVEYQQVHTPSPPRKALLMPRSSTLDQREKVEEFSPKKISTHKSPEATHDHGGKYKKLNSFDHKDENVPPHASYTAPASVQPRNDTYIEKQKVNGPNNHVPSSTYTVPTSLHDPPRKETYHETPYIGNDEKHKGNGHNQPKRETHYEPSHVDNTEKHKGNGKTPPSYTYPMTAQPKRETLYEPSHVDNNQKHKGNGYTNEKYNGSSYGSPPSQPRKDTYYEPSHIGKNEKLKENGYNTPPSYTIITIQPRKETYYQTSDNRPAMWRPIPPIKTRSDQFYQEPEYYNSPSKKDQFYQEPEYYNSPSRKDQQPYQEPGSYYNSPSRKDQHYQEPESYYDSPSKKDQQLYQEPGSYYNSPSRKDQYYQEPESYYNSPSKKDQQLYQEPGSYYSSPSRKDQYYQEPESYYNSQPRKDPRFQEVIDSAEARKRYGKGSPRGGDGEERYTGTIDCREAARKYNGVFVPN